MRYDPNVALRSRDSAPVGTTASKVVRLVPRTTSPSEPKPLLDDAEILAAIRRGDPSAASALHDRVRPRIDRTVRRLLGRPDADAEDLIQLSMIELVRSIDGFRGECSLDTWTSRVTAHTVFKELRRRRAERRMHDAAAEVAVQQHGADVDLAVTLRGSLERVREHLDALEPSKAWTVMLHDVCGYDLREIAQITETTVTAAQTRLVRGRRELHGRLQADPELAEVLEQLGGKP